MMYISEQIKSGQTATAFFDPRPGFRAVLPGEYYVGIYCHQNGGSTTTGVRVFPHPARAKRWEAGWDCPPDMFEAVDCATVDHAWLKARLQYNGDAQ